MESSFRYRRGEGETRRVEEGLWEGVTGVSGVECAVCALLEGVLDLGGRGADADADADAGVNAILYGLEVSGISWIDRLA